MHLVNNYKDADVAIHNGRFHVDEFLALQFYELATEQDVAVVRLSEIPDDFYGICIDVGNASNRDDLVIFDHHNENHSDEHALSACGKVFEFYKDILVEKMFDTKNPELAEKVFQSDILAPIQYQDNFGCPDNEQITYKNQAKQEINSFTRPISFSSAIQKFNTSFISTDSVESRFQEAYNITKDFMNSYCKTLSEKINQNVVRDQPYVSNFHRSSFNCKEQYFNESNYQPKTRDLFFNLKSSQKGISSYFHDIRQLTIGDVFSVSDENVANRLMEGTLRGYKEYEDGFIVGKKIAETKISEVEQRGDSTLVLDQFVPWRSAVLAANRSKEQNVSIDLVIFPSPRENGEWNIQTVYSHASNLEYRVDFPNTIINASAAELEKNYPGIKYVSEFIATAESKKAAIQFAQKIIDDKRTLTIQDGTLTTKDMFFSNDDKKSYRNIKLPSSLKEISPKTFQFFKYIKEVEIPSDTQIGTNAFTKCSNLDKIVIQPGIQSIGNYAFSDCTKLNNITIPASLSDINKTVFLNCPIKSVEITMTDFTQAENIIKIASRFKDSNIVINRSALGYDPIQYSEYKKILDTISERLNSDNSKSESMRKIPLSEQIQEAFLQNQNIDSRRAFNITLPSAEHEL